MALEVAEVFSLRSLDDRVAGVEWEEDAEDDKDMVTDPLWVVSLETKGYQAF